MKKLIIKKNINTNKLITIQKNFKLGKILTIKYIKKFGFNFKNKNILLNKKQKIILNNYSTIINGLKNKKKDIYLFSYKIKIYKGFRNKFKYPCRGQRTKTNAKTKKKIKL